MQLIIGSVAYCSFEVPIQLPLDLLHIKQLVLHFKLDLLEFPFEFVDISSHALYLRGLFEVSLLSFECINLLHQLLDL